VDEVSAADRSPVVRFGPDRRLTAAAGAAALLGVGLAVAADDAGGRLLFGLAAAVLAAYAISDLVWWPRLAADARGVRVHTPFTRAELRWDEVEDVRADLRSRYGVRSATLEVDAGAVLAVFSRRSLGADPQEAAELLRAMRPPG
jgi:hypothetical protein